MKKFHGIPIAPGIARGVAWPILPVEAGPTPRYAVSTECVAGEHVRLEEALDFACGELLALKRSLTAKLEDADTAIMDVHVALLRDPSFLADVKARIHRDLVTAEHAVAVETESMVARFLQMENAYMRERASDLRDIGTRLLSAFTRGAHPSDRHASFPANSIVIAAELMPSQAAELDPGRVVGILTEIGGPSSHAAILARSFGIPFVTGIPDVVQLVQRGESILIDGYTGETILSPTAPATLRFDVLLKEHEDYTEAIIHHRHEPCLTTDGVRVTLHANIGSVSEVSTVLDNGLDGVGLFRTEFLFLGTAHAPRLSVHERIYRSVLQPLRDRPVTIRVLDLGEDKIPEFLRARPKLCHRFNVRGLRFALAFPNFLRTQLRGLLRASSDGNVRILFPMVVGVDDFQAAVAHVAWAAEKEKLTAMPPVGAMIETPSALFELDGIIEFADFLSVGTNDLTQYLLAASREDTDYEGHYSMLYPGVLKALQHIVDRAARAECDVSVCGEAAGIPAVACLLVGMGFRILSMSPHRSAAVRHALRLMSANELKQIATDALQMRRVADIRRHIKERMESRVQPVHDSHAAGVEAIV
ncbi:MAG: phosphoenolpyruvate--protein phosphotransferase [Verrucomicrobia bacterium]|nr:phosphoenolpyruvate--protein phosphotransferase [Verrucomicrobiota bacterium]MDA1086925.1 phosphoenolpyruvate--protein phosphotransferase [Verrucomicrobiota bacterium]